MIKDDTVLWKEYEFYTTKFELAFYNNPVEETSDFISSSIRSYGVLNSAWAGFNEVTELLYVLNQDYEAVTLDEPLIVYSGHQS